MTSPESPLPRRAWLNQAQILLDDLDAADAELDQFNARDVPAFRAWLGQNFAAERARLTRLEALRLRWIERQNEIAAVVRLREVSVARAHQYLDVEARAYANASAEERRKIDRERRERKEFVVTDLARAFAGHHPTASRTPEDPARVTALYRTLARLIHPDVCTMETDSREERWRRHAWAKLQTARERGDGEALRDLLLVARLRHHDCANLSSAEVHRAHALITAEYAQRRAELTRARQSVAWAFDPSTAEALTPRVRRAFADDQRTLRAEVTALRRATAASPRPVRRPRGEPNQLRLFD